VSLKKYLRVYHVQLKNNFARQAIYRANFAMTVFVDLVWMAVEFTLFAVIYANTETLGGWTQDQVFFFLGLFFASDALFSTFFMSNFWQFSDLVNKGELDILLTKPVAPLSIALTRFMNPTAIFNVFLGLGIMFKYADQAGFEGGARWLLVPGWLLIGMTTAVLLRFFTCVFVFWLERGFALSRLYYQFFSMANKPDVMYPPFIRYVILTAVPFGVIASVPARALLQGLSPREYVQIAGVLLAFLGINTVLWKRGLKRYQSASS